MENFGKEKPKRRGVMTAGLAALGIATTVGFTELPTGSSEAQTIEQRTTGNNSPNIVNEGDGTINLNLGDDVKPNFSTDTTHGTIHQHSEGSGSPNVIFEKGSGKLIINGQVYEMPK